jgi:hypothetical protein
VNVATERVVAFDTWGGCAGRLRRAVRRVYGWPMARVDVERCAASDVGTQVAARALVHLSRWTPGLEGRRPYVTLDDEPLAAAIDTEGTP